MGKNKSTYDILILDNNSLKIDFINQYNKMSYKIMDTVKDFSCKNIIEMYQNFFTTKKSFYDLIFINLDMNNLNYQQILHKILNINPKQEIIIYNNNVIEIFQKNIACGIDYFLEKKEDPNHFDFDFSNITNRILFIQNSLTDTAITFLKKDLYIPLTKIIKTDKLDSHKYYTTIKYESHDILYCTIAIDEQLLYKICSSFVTYEVKDEKEKEQLIHSTTSEVANIICGLAISKFQNLQSNSLMSEPIDIPLEKLYNLNNIETTLNQILSTEFGSMYISIVKLKEQEGDI